MEHGIKSHSLGQLETVGDRAYLRHYFEWAIEFGAEFRDWPFGEEVLLESSDL